MCGAIFDTNKSDMSLHAFKSSTVSSLQTYAQLLSQAASFTTSSCLQRLKSKWTKLGQHLLNTSSKESLTHLQPWSDKVFKFDPSCLQTWIIWAVVDMCLNLKYWIQRRWRLSTSKLENLSLLVPRLINTFLQRMGSSAARDHIKQTRAAHFTSEVGRNLKIYDTSSGGKFKINGWFTSARTLWHSVTNSCTINSQLVSRSRYELCNFHFQCGISKMESHIVSKVFLRQVFVQSSCWFALLAANTIVDSASNNLMTNRHVFLLG